MCYDNLLKYWAEKYAQQMASWAFRQPITTPVEILKTELSVEPIRADSVIFLKSGPEIQHLEFQTRVPQNRPMPIRMCSYSIRLQWQYELPVRQVLIWLLPTSNPAVFETEFRTEFTHHRYQVIRLWEESPEPLLENNALLPLAVLCATQNPTELLSQVAQEVGKIQDTDLRQEIAACTQILAGLRFDNQLISTMFREEIMQESVVYQDILQKGIAQGLEQGLEQGEKQGEVAVILRLLHRFCGPLNPEIKSRIQSLIKPQLEELSEALLDFTNLADLQQWLDSH
ncbi:DUF4351 domain-containing protein [Oscillatoria sp. HE19RPO]|uniref:DUF4351 domain-containing protein n=1 Tax=Oscillatoria sp. HE19RPO TaxID=2954806 RepID=UPI0020C5916F|nr:DUF4351 domain-containing protein [Oscillatoria sp. HE19RPO]